MAECTACPTNYTTAGVAVKVEDCLFDPGKVEFVSMVEKEVPVKGAEC